MVVARLFVWRSGIQNKVLEGMAMARPVVTTPQGLEGIDARHGVELLVATTADDFAAAVQTAAQPDLGHLGAAARDLMVKAYAWPSQLRGPGPVASKLDTRPHGDVERTEPSMKTHRVRCETTERMPFGLRPVHCASPRLASGPRNTVLSP